MAKALPWLSWKSGTSHSLAGHAEGELLVAAEHAEHDVFADGA